MAQTIYEGVDNVRQSGIKIKSEGPKPTEVNLGKTTNKVHVVKYDGKGHGTTSYTTRSDSKSISGLITKELNKQYER